MNQTLLYLIIFTGIIGLGSLIIGTILLFKEKKWSLLKPFIVLGCPASIFCLISLPASIISNIEYYSIASLIFTIIFTICYIIFQIYILTVFTKLNTQKMNYKKIKLILNNEKITDSDRVTYYKEYLDEIFEIIS